MDILIIAAHPDDEVLGMGATIKKLTKQNHAVHLCVVTEGASAQYEDKKMIDVRREACIKAGKIVGISSYDFLEFPDGKLDTIAPFEINQKISKVIKKYNPDTVYTTSENDLHPDHRRLFECALGLTRPFSSNVKSLFCYEIPNAMLKPFRPNWYEAVEKEFSFKIKAMKKYDSEIEKFPHPRSLESIENLAVQRGIEAGLKKAESFQLIRKISHSQ